MNTTTCTIEKEILDNVEHYFQLAEKIFSCKFNRPICKFNIRGAKAGEARYMSPDRTTLRFNMHIAENHRSKFMTTTVPHEVAHLIDMHVYRKWGHGRTWKSIMTRLGSNPSRLHSYDNLRTASGKERPKAKCGCGIRDIGPIRYKRIKTKQSVYSCKRCSHTVQAI